MVPITKTLEHDIICALATPAGVSAIGVVRLSGPGSWGLAAQLVKRPLAELPVRRPILCSFYDLNDQVPFDQGLVTFFPEQHSFTGQESVEFYAHGSPFILSQLLHQLQRLGARMAEPGEFAFRAFMNGKIDLVQAEGILSLIESQSLEQAKQGLKHVRGLFSRELELIEQQLIRILAHLEADIDFSTEGLETASNQQLLDWLTPLIQQLTDMGERSLRGRVLKEGIHVLLMGAPNSGKSSLLNNILGEDRAIVSDQPGTTRDVIEGSILLDGVRVYFYDTAGVREAQDRIESMGIQKTLGLVSKVDLVILVVNPYSKEEDLNRFSFLAQSQIPVVTLFTHQDLELPTPISSPEYSVSSHWISNLNRDKAREVVLNVLREQFQTQRGFEQSLMMHSKQVALIQAAAARLIEAQKQLQDHLGYEIISLSAREALHNIQTVLGKYFEDDILDQIFSEFCIGK